MGGLAIEGHVIEGLKAPFPWFGGKSRAAAEVWARFGDVPNYVEPFFGSGAVLLGRPTEPGTETVNDKDRFLANFWRAVQSNPEEVAFHASWPVNETDLEARHAWLVREGGALLAALLADPDACDPKIAGWWVWGQCCWIGSGWCSGDGPWQAGDDGWLRNPGQGVNRQLPHLGNPGQGVNRQLPHLGDPGQGSCAEHVTHLVGYMSELSDRLRRVRVACGDWRRVLTPSITHRFGLTAVLLDPPYGEGELDYSAGGNREDIASGVRAWAIENGPNPNMRIALCGYDGQYEMPSDWSVQEWSTAGGYSSTASGDTQGKENRHRERIWFSPHCLRPGRHLQADLFDSLSDTEQTEPPAPVRPGWLGGVEGD